MEIKLLPCPVCSTAHYQDVLVLRNALVQVTKKLLPCPICNEIFQGLDKFTIHLFTHVEVAEITENIEVNDCNDNNNNAESNQNCDVCDFECSDTNILEMHKNLLHSSGFPCEFCEKTFKMHGSLMIHMRVAHCDVHKNPTNVTAEENNANNKQEGNSVISAEDQTRSVKNCENKQWECDVCMKRFTTKYFLKKHKRLHTGEMPYECTLCNKSFTFQQSYHKHMLYHSADKPHSCTECGRAFKELSTLHNHQRIHSGERPFECETCGKRFRQRVSYLVHKRIHTGAMPYKCTSCDKSFRYKVSQRTHKCKTQPPGSVIRQFGDLVQKILQNRSPDEVVPAPVVQSDVNEKPNVCPDVAPDFFGLVMSPTFQLASDQFETLCLTNKDTNEDNLFHSVHNETNPFATTRECSTINEECFKQLLYNPLN